MSLNYKRGGWFMTKDEMKKVVCQAIDKAAEKIHETVLRIESEPELGYKETKTSAKWKVI